MGIEFFNDGKHVCLMFSDLVEDGEGDPVQANQFLIVNDDTGILLDPGGVMTYNELYLAMSRYFPPKNLRYAMYSPRMPIPTSLLPCRAG